MSIKNLRDELTQILTSNNIYWKYGRRGDLELNLEDSNDPHDESDDYITFESSDGDGRVGIAFSEDLKKILSIKIYA